MIQSPTPKDPADLAFNGIRLPNRNIISIRDVKSKFAHLLSDYFSPGMIYQAVDALVHTYYPKELPTRNVEFETFIEIFEVLVEILYGKAGINDDETAMTKKHFYMLFKNSFGKKAVLMKIPINRAFRCMLENADEDGDAALSRHEFKVFLALFILNEVTIEDFVSKTLLQLFC